MVKKRIADDAISREKARKEKKDEPEVPNNLVNTQS